MISKYMKISHKQSVLFYGTAIGTSSFHREHWVEVNMGLLCLEMKNHCNFKTLEKPLAHMDPGNLRTVADCRGPVVVLISWRFILEAT